MRIPTLDFFALEHLHISCIWPKCLSGHEESACRTSVIAQLEHTTWKV